MAERKKVKRELNGWGLDIGKIVVRGENMKFDYGERKRKVWRVGVRFEVGRGKGLWIKGDKGRGKRRVVKVIRGEVRGRGGRIEGGEFRYIYVDEE